MNEYVKVSIAKEKKLWKNISEKTQYLIPLINIILI